MSKRYVDIKETAALIRYELKQAFPKTQFSVRLQRYSMGSHITVRWTDGPSVRQVEAITDQRYGTGFDSMTDSTTHHDVEYNGEILHFAGSRPHCEREISPGFETACTKAWEALDGHERCVLLNNYKFPRWPEDRPGRRLASFIAAP